MDYTIGEVARMFNITISTLRYYDKEGLLLNINKDNSGIRKFNEQNIEAIRIIEYLKKSGMSLKSIKEFMDWCAKGDSTLSKRYEMFAKQEETIKDKIKELENTLELIEFKKWYYSEALKDGSEKRVKSIKTEMMPKRIQELYKNTHC